MAAKLRDDLSFSTDINAFDPTEPNHADTFNRRANQHNSNDAYLKKEVDDVKRKLQEGLPAKGGNADTVDECHAGTSAGDVLKLDARGKVAESVLSESVKTLWMPSTAYTLGETVQPIAFARHLIFICSKAGTTNGTQPVWPTKGGENVTDGTVAWQTINLRDAATLDGHAAGTDASSVLVLDAGGRVPHKVLSFMSDKAKILEEYLANAVKKWWMPSSSYVLGQMIEPLGAIHGQVYKCIQAGTSGSAEPAWPTEDYSEFTDGSVKWRTLSIESMSGHVGQMNFPAMIVRKNEVKLNGALLSRIVYPELWEYANDSGLVITESAYNSARNGMYSSGTDGTNFRVPNLKGFVLRVMPEGSATDSDSNRALGSTQGDAIRNILGTINTFVGNPQEWNGAFRTEISTPNRVMTTGTTVTGYGSVTFEAAQSVQTAAENRVKNIAYFATVRYK